MSGNSRRLFLRKIGLLAGASIGPARRLARAAEHGLQDSHAGTNEHICRDRFELAVRESLIERPIGDVMVAIGVSFLGTPYAAHTLEADGPEHLVLNLQGLDCVTFVENTLALSRCVKLGADRFEDYAAQLQLIRYRDGIISGYPSRLHYFSEWIQNNHRKGVLQDITGAIGGIPYEKEIDFMSAHRGSYRQLSNDTVYVRIKEMESMLNDVDRLYLPKKKLSQNPDLLQPGDIIGITTSVDGLDIVHTGIAVHSNGAVKYLHAPLSGGSVQISDEPLGEYLMARKNQTGVIAARPLEPR